MIVIQSRSSNRYAITRDQYTSDINAATQFETIQAAEKFLFEEIALGRESEYPLKRANFWIVVDGKKHGESRADRMRRNSDGPTGYGW